MGLLLPWWVKWLAMLALVVGAFGFGVVRGIDFESMRRDARDAAAMREFDAARKVYVREVVKIKTRYIERRQADIRAREDIMGEVVAHATQIPDPTQCWLDERRVRSINRAIEPGPDGPGSAETVRRPDEAGLGQPPGDRGVGGGNGLRLPGVLGQAPDSGGDGQGPGSDRGAARGG